MFRHHKHFGTKFCYSNFLCSNCTEVFAETKSFLNKFNIDVSSLLMSSLRAIVICHKYFGNHMISSQIHLFAPLLNMRCCTLWYSWLQISFYHNTSLPDCLYDHHCTIVAEIRCYYIKWDFLYLVTGMGYLYARNITHRMILPEIFFTSLQAWDISTLWTSLTEWYYLRFSLPCYRHGISLCSEHHSRNDINWDFLYLVTGMGYLYARNITQGMILPEIFFTLLQAWDISMLGTSLTELY